MYLLEMNHVGKSFGELNVLKDISLNVKEGEVVSIIGPSGSGKSTLLRLATLLERMDTGELFYEGKCVCRNSEQQKSIYAHKNELKQIAKSFGLVFQNFNLFPHYSVLKNVTDPMVRVLSKSKEEANDTALKLLDQMGIKDKASYYPHQLSGGQQQRVSIARALGLSPKVLFFDEPTSALDPELTGEILKVIRELAARKMTMVIVTHEMNFAKNVADRVIFMEKGVVVEEGAAGEVFSSSNRRVRDFIGKLGA